MNDPLPVPALVPVAGNGREAAPAGTTAAATAAPRLTPKAIVRGQRGSVPSPGSSGITSEKAAGSSVIKLSQGKAEDAADMGRIASITGESRWLRIYQRQG